MSPNLQISVTEALSLASNAQQSLTAIRKLFGRLDKSTRNALILALSLAGLAYCVSQYLDSRR